MKTISYLKLISAALFIALLTPEAQAQPEVLIGGRTGMNIGSFRWDAATRNNSNVNTKSSIGPHVSFVTVVKFAHWFGLQAEAGYVQRGAKAVFDADNLQGQNEQGQTVTVKDYHEELLYKVNYIDVPLLARFQLGSDKFAFVGKLGPTFSLALNGTGRNTVSYSDAQGKEQPTIQNTNKLNFDKDFNRFDIGATVALGTEIGAGPGAVIFDLRYILGITDASKAKKIDDRVKNRSFQIGIGYIVRL